MIKQLVTIGMCLMLQMSVNAATEYLRFEGNISANYQDIFNELHDVDFVASQSIWFDIEIDTELNPDGFSDSEVVDYFQSILLGGTVGSGEANYGASGRVVEFLYGMLTLNSGLQLISPISRCDEDPIPPGCSLANPIPEFDWGVGTDFYLVPDGPTSQDIFGVITLTYRDSQPPPPIPLPGAVWLMISALFATGWLGKRSVVSD